MPATVSLLAIESGDSSAGRGRHHDGDREDRAEGQAQQLEILGGRNDQDEGGHPEQD